jgi:hypothetical protein
MLARLALSSAQNACVEPSVRLVTATDIRSRGYQASPEQAVTELARVLRSSPLIQLSSAVERRGQTLAFVVCRHRPSRPQNAGLWAERRD